MSLRRFSCTTEASLPLINQQIHTFHCCGGTNLYHRTAFRNHMFPNSEHRVTARCPSAPVHRSGLVVLWLVFRGVGGIYLGVLIMADACPSSRKPLAKSKKMNCVNCRSCPPSGSAKRVGLVICNENSTQSKPIAHIHFIE